MESGQADFLDDIYDLDFLFDTDDVCENMFELKTQMTSNPIDAACGNDVRYFDMESTMLRIAYAANETALEE